MPLSIINYTPLVEGDGNITPVNRLLANIRYGGAWVKEIQAQETVISLLRKLLSDRFTLIRNFTLPDEEIPIPLLLVSASGIWLIAVSEDVGIFKTQGKEMFEMDSKKHEFVPKSPNLVMRTILLARAFEDFLTKYKIPVPPIEPILIFTNPGVDMTTEGDTNIRVLLVDALSRFVSGISVTPVRMEPGTTKKIIDLIKYTHTKTKKAAEKKSEGPKLNFSPRQWMILGFVILVLFLAVTMAIFVFLNP
ncbi:MAG TPA: hypothetical protein PK530_06520 [Anaerolineales bacterium]|nr:hypothetical protein [Anaerolineales bacterium]